MVAPSQYGPPFEAVGVAGVALTTTLVVPAADVQLLTVTVTEYMPASAVVALERVGFCSAEVKPFGPVHEYVAPATVGVESAMVAPSQYGPPFEARAEERRVVTARWDAPAAEPQTTNATATE